MAWTDSIALAVVLGPALRARGWRMGAAESCTGGLLAAAVTSVPGSSEWFTGGVVSYANEVKQKALGVPAALVRDYGAVSGPVVRAMAVGARPALSADVTVAISGVAGPGGGSPEKPVGTVWMAWAWPTGERAQSYYFEGDREAVRLNAVWTALSGLLALVRTDRTMPGKGVVIP